MQRTVKMTKITYAKIVVENGDVQTQISAVEIPETDHNKAIKLAKKEVGDFTPIKCENVTYLFELEDDKFFSMAHKTRVED